MTVASENSMHAERLDPNEVISTFAPVHQEFYGMLRSARSSGAYLLRKLEVKTQHTIMCVEFF